jgi:hypothetical protein
MSGAISDSDFAFSRAGAGARAAKGATGSGLASTGTSKRAGFSASGVADGVCFSWSFHRAMTALLVLLRDGRGYA